MMAMMIVLSAKADLQISNHIIVIWKIIGSEFVSDRNYIVNCGACVLCATVEWLMCSLWDADQDIRMRWDDGLLSWLWYHTYLLSICNWSHTYISLRFNVHSIRNTWSPINVYTSVHLVCFSDQHFINTSVPAVSGSQHVNAIHVR